MRLVDQQGPGCPERIFIDHVFRIDEFYIHSRFVGPLPKPNVGLHFVLHDNKALI